MLLKGLETKKKVTEESTALVPCWGRRSRRGI